MSSGNRKLVVLGIPWDVDTEALRAYMCQFGDLADVVVMKDRASGRSCGFGYVTFCSFEGAEKPMATQHILQGRVLEVKIATPKIAVDRAAPLDEIPFGGAGGLLRGHSSIFAGSNYGNMPASLGFNSGWTPYGNLGSMASSDEGLSGH